MLHDAIFLVTCLATSKQEIHCKLQNSCYTLQSRAATCNGLKMVYAMIAESSTELYSVKSLQVQESCQTKLQIGHVTH